MHTGKLLFAQLMEHLPPMVFERCVARYGGHHKVKSFSCMDQFLCMAFAQLTFRESLRDIEACLRSQAEKLYHMGIRRGRAQHARERQRDPRLADLRRLRPALDRYRPEALRRRTVRRRPDEHRVCARLDDHRLVLVAVPVGAVSNHQGGDQAAHAHSICAATSPVLSISATASCTT